MGEGSIFEDVAVKSRLHYILCTLLGTETPTECENESGNFRQLHKLILLRTYWYQPHFRIPSRLLSLNPKILLVYLNNETSKILSATQVKLWSTYLPPKIKLGG